MVLKSGPYILKGLALWEELVLIISKKVQQY